MLGRSFTVGPGTCLVLPPGCRVEADHDLRRPAVNLAIHGRFLDRDGRAVAPDPAPPLHTVLPDPLRLAQRVAGIDVSMCPHARPIPASIIRCRLELAQTAA